ncbi:MAG: hypothetical protein ACI97B_001932 [Verrucomicrobiales bacterium]|jgi:hypothetical protein
MKNILTVLSLMLVTVVSADIIPPTLNWEAALDTNGNNIWESSVNHEANTRFLFGSAQSTTDVSGTSNLPGVQSAYAMPAASGDMSSFSTITIPGGGNASLMDASFELVFRPISLSTNYFVFETGGTGSGAGIFIKDSQIVFRAQQSANAANDAEVTVPLGAGDLNKFHQVVGTIDLDAAAGANSISLYLNGVFIGSDFASDVLNAFAGGDSSGIGNLGGGSLTGHDNATVQNMFDNFDGDIAILRYYQNQVLSPTQVQQNYDALLIPEPSSFALVFVGALFLSSFRRRS